MSTETLIGQDSIKEVRLYGVLGKKFGRVHRLAVKTPREAAQALAATIPGFRQYLMENSQPGYHVFVGKRSIANNIGSDLLDGPVSSKEAISIVPAIAGSKRGGVLQTIVGVVLIVASFFVPVPGMLQLGITLAMGGVIQMLTPVTRQNKRNEKDQVSSYHFDGPTNQTREGAPIQITFGRMIVGSSVVAQGIYSSDIAL